MDFQMSINLDNAAFVTEEGGLDPTGLVRILHQVIKQIENGYEGNTCMDINGNTVGRWEISE